MIDSTEAEVLVSRRTTNIMVLMLAYDDDFFAELCCSEV